MEKFAYEIKGLIQKTLSLYEKIYDVLLKEKSHIVDMDVNSLWNTISQKKSLAMSIEAIKRESICLFNATYPGLETNTDLVTFPYIIKIMNISSEKKVELKNLLLHIDTAKKDIKGLSSENSKFINEYLSVIDGIFSTVTNGKDNGNYSNFGHVLKQDGENHLIYAKV